MFIARSAARIRFARTVFLLAGLLPCAALVAAAVYLRSDDHRERVRREWQHALGQPLAIGAVERPRPGVVRARHCSLAAPAGPPLVGVESVDVETTAAEVRLRIAALECDAAGIRALAGIAGDWLARPALFSRDCVVEIGSLAWRGRDVGSDGGRPEEIGRLRIECVARGESRAVRVVLGDAAGAEEIRVVSSPEVADGVPSCRVEVAAACGRLLPVELVVAAAGGWPAGPPSGGRAGVRGRLDAVRSRGTWSGAAVGFVEHLELAGRGSGGTAGELSLGVRRLDWHEGRVVRCAVDWLSGPGRIERRVVDAAVRAGLLRPGRGLPASGAEPVAFDGAAGVITIDGSGVRLAAAGASSVLAVRGGLPVAEAGAVVPVAWLAELLAASTEAGHPSGIGGWILSALAPDRPGAVDGRSPPSSRPERVGRRAEF